MRKLLPFLKYLKEVKYQFIFALLCGFGYAGMSGLGIPVIFEKVFKKIFEDGFGHYTTLEVLGLSFLLPIIFLARGAFSFLNTYFMSYAGMSLCKSLKDDIFKHIQYLPMEFFDKHTQGDLIARIAADPNAVQSVMLQLASEGIRQPAQVLSAIGALIYICYTNDSFFFFPIFIFAVLISFWPIRMIKKHLKFYGASAQAVEGGVYQSITENLSATAEVKSFNLEKAQIKRHSDQLDIARKFGLKIVKYRQLQQPTMELLSAIVVSVVFAYAYHIKMPFSSFSAVGLALYFALDPIKRIGNLLGEVHRTEASVDRVKYILDMPLTIKDPENPVPVGRLKGDIDYKNVAFAYNDEHPTLKNITAHIPTGTSCALVGSSGAGKSTFAKLISRFYDTKGGVITIDGIDIKSMKLEDLRRNIAIVSQYPVLFNDTIYNNIKLGKDDATEEEVYNATRKAFAHEFIMELHEGYQTKVGNRGDLISGGQKQRIALARAFLKDAPILVLDEATSALDSNSEHFIQQALQELSKNKTVFIIAHRLSTIKNADKILVFKDGEIIGSGKHHDLINSNDVYRNFVEKQNLLRTNPLEA